METAAPIGNFVACTRIALTTRLGSRRRHKNGYPDSA